MIKRYKYGNPINTGAVVDDCFENIEEVIVSEASATGEDGNRISLIYPLDAEDAIYGLGETMRGINKRGYRYIMYNTDDPHHKQDMPSLYGAHNFLVIDGISKLGIFVDTPARTTFDVDVDDSGEIRIVAESSDAYVYEITGDSAYDITHQFLKIIGRSFIPPLWAFGFCQSRWGYKNAKDVDTVIKKYREANIPLDSVCIDIDYMDRFIDFTINPKRFPNMKEYVDEKKTQGIHLVPIIDAGVKIEPGDPTYEEGIAGKYFCTNAEGKEYKAAVWPGLTHFPDFFKSDTRKWFGGRYKVLTDLGLDGFWNDMNEPAVFYSESTPKESNLDRVLNFLIKSRAERKQKGESNAYISYRHFFHDIDGKKVCHHDVHNLYGALMTRAAGEGLSEILDHRYLLYTRSTYIGSHRYGGLWTGDNNSSFEMLKQNLQQMPGLNMCGYIYSGADTGGFGGNCTRELLLRWLALSTFTPLMRDHSCMGTRNQECYAFGDTDAFRRVVNLRYRLIPYIYSEFMKAALAQDMFIKPLAFEYGNDKTTASISDQLLVGEGIMIAPVVEEGVNGRDVYLPEEMIQVRFDGEKFETEVCQAGFHYIQVPLHQVVFYIRNNKSIVVSKKQYTSTIDMDLSDVERLGYDVEYDHYIDDGISKLQ